METAGPYESAESRRIKHLPSTIHPHPRKRKILGAGRVVDVCRSWHSRLQLDHLAIYNELAVSEMVDGLRILLRRINPGLEHFKNEEVVLVDETSVGHLAFEIGKTLGHERRCHPLGWRRRQTKPLELVHISSRAVAYFHAPERQFELRNGAHALFRRPQCCKAVIGVADAVAMTRGGLMTSSGLGYD